MMPLVIHRSEDRRNDVEGAAELRLPPIGEIGKLHRATGNAVSSPLAVVSLCRVEGRWRHRVSADGDAMSKLSGRHDYTPFLKEW